MPQGGKPEVLKRVGIEQRLNEQLPLDATFRDETGRTVRLADYFKQGKPVLLSLVYYDCPMLCNQVLNGQVGMMEALPFNAGREFTALTVSFDPRELPELAAKKRETYLKRYGRGGSEAGWHFLTGDEANIRRLTDAVGFQYLWDEGSQQFAHASAIMVVTPEGKLSHYFYGIEYSPKDTRLALVEASQGRIGSRVDQLLLYCYHYDPTTGKFAVVISIMRVAGLLTLVGIAALLWVLWRRGKRERQGGSWDESVNVGGTA
jgi:protein SCO1/2